MRIDSPDTRFSPSRRRLFAGGAALGMLSALPVASPAAPRRDDEADWIPTGSSSPTCRGRCRRWACRESASRWSRLAGWPYG
ncbi:hypothetical protein H1235_17350 [Pseudoxanthomonas sp. NC8]|nr:hypothetical protein H1235_17350 [Pseudoxanthomonas sp. NC8]